MPLLIWDQGWLSIEITYGLYLSDHTILDKVDTELIVLSGIMIQNLALETGWHLRGTRRIGVSFEDVETIHQIVSPLPLEYRMLMTLTGLSAGREGRCILRSAAYPRAQSEGY